MDSDLGKDKTIMSSRLSAMKFMQRGPSARIKNDTDAPQPKRRRIYDVSDKGNQDGMQKSSTPQRSSTNAADSEWHLNTRLLTYPLTSQSTMKIESASLGSLDAAMLRYASEDKNNDFDGRRKFGVIRHKISDETEAIKTDMTIENHHSDNDLLTSPLSVER